VARLDLACARCDLRGRRCLFAHHGVLDALGACSLSGEVENLGAGPPMVDRPNAAALDCGRRLITGGRYLRLPAGLESELGRRPRLDPLPRRFCAVSRSCGQSSWIFARCEECIVGDLRIALKAARVFAKERGETCLGGLDPAGNFRLLVQRNAVPEPRPLIEGVDVMAAFLRKPRLVPDLQTCVGGVLRRTAVFGSARCADG